MSGRFHRIDSGISGVSILERRVSQDQRGAFERLFDLTELREFGWQGDVHQVNRSRTDAMGTVRGMHFQTPPWGEWKLVTCTAGSVHDVIVDLRKNSKTFRQWISVALAAESNRSVMIPPGCAHGFQVLRPMSELLYVHSQPYVPESDSGIRADDPLIAIAWPLAIASRSDRDAGHRLLDRDWQGLEV